MNIELIKNEFIKLKKEELQYLDNVAKISSNKTLSEREKLEIYRAVNHFEDQLIKIIKKLQSEIIKGRNLSENNFGLKDVIIEFDLSTDFLSSLKFPNEEYKKYTLNRLGIDSDTFKFKLAMSNIIHPHDWHWDTVLSIIQNNQTLKEKPIYIFCGYYDSYEDCYGPASLHSDGNIYGIYEHIYDSGQEEIPKKLMDDFEKDKLIIYSTKYVYPCEIREIFKEELLNTLNKSLNDCVIQTRNRIEKLNYIRSPEYKERVLLGKISELYKKVKGKLIKKEILYSGDFLAILSEIYKLPNGRVVKKEKIIKNNGKNSVIVIAITQDKKYIITFQNRIKDKQIAEFPSGYVEAGEEVIAAAKRELQEETGFISDDLFIVDEAYTSPGIDNSITYIVVANNCIKFDEKKIDGNELVSYGLFSEEELNYLISNNIMSGAINKLAYYNLISNVENCDFSRGNQRIYKKLRKKTNPFVN